MFHYGTQEQQQQFSRKLKQVFYIRNKKWTRAIVHRGMEVLQEVMCGCVSGSGVVVIMSSIY